MNRVYRAIRRGYRNICFFFYDFPNSLWNILFKPILWGLLLVFPIIYLLGHYLPVRFWGISQKAVILDVDSVKGRMGYIMHNKYCYNYKGRVL